MNCYSKYLLFHDYLAGWQVSSWEQCVLAGWQFSHLALHLAGSFLAGITVFVNWLATFHFLASIIDL